MRGRYACKRIALLQLCTNDKSSFMAAVRALLIVAGMLVLLLGLSGCGKETLPGEGASGEVEIFDEKVFDEETPSIYRDSGAEETEVLDPATTVSGDREDASDGARADGISDTSGQGQQAAGETNAGTQAGATGSSGRGQPGGAGASAGGTTAQAGGSGTAPLQTVPYGALAVDGTQLVDGSGNPVQLRGVSTHGLAWYPDYVNAECFRELKEEWGMNVVRLAMYTAEYGGYCSGGDKDSLKALVKNGVQYATDCGLYVIIDWHILSDGNPNTYIEEAKTFFGEMSEEYADYTNVLYEICNEPNGGVAWSDVKSYAEQIIEVIRGNDEDGVILVGTPNWSQYVDQAAADPIQGYSNIMYTLHFYAATHKDSLRTTMISAVEAGLPVFVSEYGICDASGNGGIDTYEANLWVDTMNTYGISYVAWNLSNKSETSAIIKSDCSKKSGFTEGELSDSGKWLYEMLGAAGTLGETANSNHVTANTGSAGSGSSSSNGSSGDAGQGGNANADGNNSGNANASGSVDTSSGQGGWTGNEPTGSILEGEALQVTAQMINSWGQGDETFYQYSLTINNLTQEEGSGWKIQLVFDGDITLNNGWNGNYQTEGAVLTITSMDYNGRIPAGGSTDNIGFIIQGGEGLSIVEANSY